MSAEEKIYLHITFVKEVLGRNTYCVIYIMMLSHQGWKEPHSLEELLRTVSEDVVTLKKNNHVLVSFKFSMVGYQRKNHPSTDFGIVDLKESAVASVGKNGNIMIAMKLH